MHAPSAAPMPFRFSALLALSLLAAAPAAAQCVSGTQGSGALFELCPAPATAANADGDTLVVYAHGYVFPQEPLGIPTQLGGTDLRAALAARGYGYAATSFYKNGLVEPTPGLADLADAVDRYAAAYGAPARVLLLGVSNGALLSALALERDPARYDGGLLACGPLGSYARQVDYLADIYTVFDFFFPGELQAAFGTAPGDADGIEPAFLVAVQQAATAAGTTPRDAFAGAVVSILSDPNNAAAAAQLFDVIATTPDIDARFSGAGEAVATVVSALSFVVFGTNDSVATLGGAPYDNGARVYQSSFGAAFDAQLNGSIARFTADAAARAALVGDFETTGALADPAVGLHTTRDGLVPVWQATDYSAEVGAGPFSLQTIDRAGHCTFTPAEVDAGLDRLSPQGVFAGTQGYRLVASPDPAATLDALLDEPLWTQGAAGSDAPAGTATVYRWDEPAMAWTAVTDLADPAGSQGAAVYMFADDNLRTAPVDGGFPKSLSVPAPVPFVAAITYAADGSGDAPLSYTPPAPKTAGVAATFEGYNLLAAPTASGFGWDAAARTDVAPTVSVYDPALAAYRTYTQGVGPGSPGLAGGVVEPFTGFFVRAQSASASLTLDLAPAAAPRPAPATESAVVALAVGPDGGALPATRRGGALLALGVDGAAAGVDALDAGALVPPAEAYVALATEADRGGAPAALAVDVRPWPEQDAEIPVRLTLVGAAAGEPLRLAWPRLERVPESWTLTLRDRATGAEVDLRTEPGYAFTATASDVGLSNEPPRFVLAVGLGRATGAEGPAAGVEVSAVAPNPSAGRASVQVTVAGEAHVRAVLVDALGRELAVVADGPQRGRARLDLDTGALAPGLYVLRVEVDGQATTRRLAVVR